MTGKKSSTPKPIVSMPKPKTGMDRVAQETAHRKAVTRKAG